MKNNYEMFRNRHFDTYSRTPYLKGKMKLRSDDPLYFNHDIDNMNGGVQNVN